MTIRNIFCIRPYTWFRENFLRRIVTAIEYVQSLGMFRFFSVFFVRTLSPVDTIVGIHRRLVNCSSLAPSYRVNRDLSALCRMVSQRHASERETLSHPRVMAITDSLRSLCAGAECEMERYWAQKVIRSFGKKHAWRVLSRFWYLKNYTDITIFEYHLLQKNGYVHSSDKRAVFIGGGPLPLTAIMLWKKYGIKSVVIDNDFSAVSASQQMLQKLGLDNAIDVRQADGATFTDYDDVGVVFAASLAGMSNEEKARILNTIGCHISFDTYVVVRSVTGLRTLLYPPVNTDDITTLDILDHEDPAEGIINSAYICKKT